QAPSSVLHSNHHLGTTRMSSTPNQGVVDADGRVYGLDNLYVAGGSVLPTSSWANPTWTVTALTLRLADYLRDTAEGESMSRGFSHVGLSTHDMATTCRFYEEILGFPRIVDEVTHVDQGGRLRQVFFDVGEGQYVVFMEA